MPEKGLRVWRASAATSSGSTRVRSSRRTYSKGARNLGKLSASFDETMEQTMDRVRRPIRGYTGFVRRDSIASQADAAITSFGELATMVLG